MLTAALRKECGTGEEGNDQVRRAYLLVLRGNIARGIRCMSRIYVLCTRGGKGMIR